MRTSHWRVLLLLLAAVPAVALGQAVPGPSTAVVNSVLFFSPSCPHCHKVMTEDLPPLIQRYGGRLRIATVDVTTSGGQALYQATVAYFALPDDRLGVPTLVVGSRVLVGSQEIPDELPGIVDRGLAAGGIGWPPVPAIRTAIARAEQSEAQRQAAAESAAAPTAAPAPVAARPDSARAAARDTAGAGAVPERAATPGRPAPAAPSPVRPAAPTSATPGPEHAATAPQRSAAPVATGAPDSAPASGAETPPAAAVPAAGAIALGGTTGAPSVRERFLRDPAGNTAAVLVLVAMLAALGLVGLVFVGRRVALWAAPSWVVPLLAIAGLGVAGYLAVVEVTGVRAVCGPVGDCNTVQQSEYARLFGVLPIGVLGMVGYVGMLGAWALAVVAPGKPARLAILGGWGIALSGTLFSVYLTFLEPFVIGATCAWCLTSAVLITLLLLVLTPPARLALRGASDTDASGTS
jgi:uncharacterized membrane protein